VALREGGSGFAALAVGEGCLFSALGLPLDAEEEEFGFAEVFEGELAGGGEEMGAPAELEDGNGLVVTGALEPVVEGVVLAEGAEFGAADCEERRIRRGTKRMARILAAAALTRKSRLERGGGLGEMTRRGLPMLALTCGSEETGMGARDGSGAGLGETGESGTARGSICGRVTRRVARGDAEGRSDAASKDSGELGASGGRM